jgi:alpha-glutamyl/putrescinyl thymine pyrophosphorylase clade 1
MSQMIQSSVEGFFAFCRERHQIYLRRQAGDPWPWTRDPILQRYKFTNVFRELDRTTVWFREHVRDRMRADPAVLLATVVFRWFCRQEIGEVIFNSRLLPISGVDMSPWSVFLRDGDVSDMRVVIKSAFLKGPYVTGAYMLRSPTGMSKLDGMLSLCEGFWRCSNWREVGACMLPNSRHLEYFPPFGGPVSMQSFTRWLQEFPGMGPFLAYEVACDLQYTDLLNLAPDVATWANVGPGAGDGLNRLRDVVNERPRKPKHKWRTPIPESLALEMMRELLSYSQSEYYWPQSWRSWDMRTVEHSLCEFSKYERARLGEGTPKQNYTPRLVALPRRPDGLQ